MKDEKVFSVKINAREIISGLRNEFHTAFLSSFFGLIIIFIPFSLLSPANLKLGWDILIHSIGFLLSFCGSFFLLKLFIKNEESEILGAITVICCLIFFSLILCLYVMRLIPLHIYIPRYYIAIFFLIIFSYEFYNHSYKYKSYLNQSLEFVEYYSFLIIIICIFRILIHTQSLFLELSKFSFSFSAEFVASLIKIFLLMIIIRESIKYIYKTKQNNKKDFVFYFSKLLIVLIMLQAINYIAYSNFEFFYFGLIALLTTIFYTARNPSEKKSSKLFVLANLTFISFLLVDILYPNLLKTIILGTKIDTILTIIAIITNIIIFFKGQKYLKVEGNAISKFDIDQAIKELFDENGFVLKFINNSVRISIISGRFVKLRHLLSKLRENIDKEHLELFKYFELYLYCAEFNKKHKIYVDDKKIEGILYRKFIENRKDFSAFVRKNFPTSISSCAVWQSYANNDLILFYLGDKSLVKEVKPKIFKDKLKSIVNSVVIFIVIVTFGLSTVPPEAMAELSKITLGAKNVVVGNINRVRLQFATAFKAYDNADWKNYYAFNTFVWSSDAFKLSKRKRTDLLNYLERLKQILEYYNKNDFLYGRINHEIGLIYKDGLNNFENAIPFFKKAIITNKDEYNFFDNALYCLAECYIKKNEHIKAKEILEHYENNTKLIDSNIFLAIINIYFSDYEKAKKILYRLKRKSKNQRIDALILICESHIDEKNGDRYLTKIEKLCNENGYKSSMYEIILLEHCAGIMNYCKKDYFKSSDYLYQAMSKILMYNTNCVSKANLLESANILIKASKEVINKNKKDYRVHLWLSTAYLIKGDKSSSITHFKNHLKYSPKSFERIYSQYYIHRMANELKNQI